jgi:hypothetical protein
MQRELLDGLHTFNLVLKGRQLGVSTFCSIFLLDAALFNSGTRCGIICHRLDDVRVLLRKLKDTYDRLPDVLKQRIPVIKDAADELAFANDSSIRVGTTLRGDTMHYLHVSEFAQVAANYPAKAQEIITGSINTLPLGAACFMESTACGMEGSFFQMCETAQSKQRLGEELSQLDWKFFFLPWWRQEEYAIDSKYVTIDDNYRKYFESLKELHGIELTEAQQKWYVKKCDGMPDGSMHREFPSTPEESFATSADGAYYSAQLAKLELEQRLGDYPALPGRDVHVSWDLGVNDANSLWFFQKVPGRVRFVGFYQNSGEPMTFYLDVVAELARRQKWSIGNHYVPHDARVKEWAYGNTRIGSLLSETSKRRIGRDVRLVPGHLVNDGIEASRRLLDICSFDAAACAEGIRYLRNYRKEWNEELGTWRDKPRHDENSHAADAFRYAAVSWVDVPEEVRPEHHGYDPSGRAVDPPPKFEFLQGMTWARFHELTHTELGRTKRHRERV